MEHFRKIWNEEKHKWLLEHKDKNRQMLYEQFLKAFNYPDITFCAFCNERSRIGASPTVHHGSTKKRPLFSEQEKKGYIRIKVAEPNVWIMKSRYIYEQNHKDYVYSENDCFIFLDGNNRNFDSDNIEMIPRSLIGVFNGINKGCKNPEEVRVNIALAKLKVKQLDVGEKLGLVTKQGHCRKWKDEAREYQKRLNSTPERKKLLAERRKQKYRERTPEKIEADRIKHREWCRANKDKIKAYRK